MKKLLIGLFVIGATSAHAEFCDWNSAQDKVAEQVKKEMCINAVSGITCDNLRTGAVGLGIGGVVKVLYSYDVHFSDTEKEQKIGYQIIDSECKVVDEGAENFLSKKY